MPDETIGVAGGGGAVVDGPGKHAVVGETTNGGPKPGAVDQGLAGNLRRHILSGPELLAQSVGNIAPTAGAGLGIAIVAGQVGHGSWLTWVISSIAMLLVGYCIVQIARHFATAGSVFSYVTKGLGPFAGVVTGASWAGIVATGPVLVMLFGIFFTGLMVSLHVPADNIVGQIIIYALAIAVTAYFAFRDIKLSTNLLLVLELISMAVILALLAVVFWKKGGIIDADQLTLKGSDLHGILFGIIITIFAFGGFESAASLGLEARDPKRGVPFGVIGSIVIVGLFLTLNAYGQVFAYEGAKQHIQDSPNPLVDISTMMGVSFFQIIIGLGLSLSMFSCMIANFNHGSRLLMTMSRDRLLPSALGRVHPSYNTPHVAIGLFAAIWLVFALLVAVTRANPVSWVTWLGTYQGDAYLTGYLLVAVAAPVFLARMKVFSVRVAIVAAIAAITLGFVFVNSVYPPPAFPGNIPSYAFIVVTLVALGYFAVMRRRHPEVSALVRSTDEAIQ